MSPITPLAATHKRGWQGLLAIIGFALAVPVACDDSANTWRAPAGTPPHVVVVLIDTLRRDHTSLGGYARETTPGLARLSALGVEYINHFANAPWTKSSVATLLTGLLPSAHGAQWGERSVEFEYRVDVLADGFLTLPEVLREHGYRTHAYMTNTSLSKSLGFAQGFDQFVALPPTLAGDRQSIDRTLRTLDRATQPSFVWCHLMAVHNYVLPAGRQRFSSDTQTPIDESAKFGSRLQASHLVEHHEDAVDRYDSTIAYADALVTLLVAHIRQMHPNTLVIVTSDHGEEFLEHGGYLHARTLYNEMLRVPLVMSGPGLPQGVSVDRLTDHADLFATVLDYLGLPDANTQGESLLRADADSSQAVYAEKRNGLYAARSLITPEGKFVESKPRVTRGTKPSIAGEGSWEFFPDPVGRDDDDRIAEVGPAAIAAATSEMDRIWIESQEIHQAGSLGQATQREMTPDELEALKALGYAE